MAEFQRQKLYIIAWFVPSVPWIDSPSSTSSCGSKRQREESEEETFPGAEDIWYVETLCGLKMKLKRRRVSSVLPEHHEVFNRLLGRKSTLQSYPFFFS